MAGHDPETVGYWMRNCCKQCWFPRKWSPKSKILTMPRQNLSSTACCLWIRKISSIFRDLGFNMLNLVVLLGISMEQTEYRMSILILHSSPRVQHLIRARTHGESPRITFPYTRLSFEQETIEGFSWCGSCLPSVALESKIMLILVFWAASMVPARIHLNSMLE